MKWIGVMCNDDESVCRDADAMMTIFNYSVRMSAN